MTDESSLANFTSNFGNIVFLKNEAGSNGGSIYLNAESLLANFTSNFGNIVFLNNEVGSNINK